MRVPLLDLKAQMTRIRPEIDEQISDVLDTCQFILGEKVTSFEKAVAEYSGVNHAVGVSSGTDALLIALMALDIGPGDIVLTTPYSFFATAGAVSRLGATPAFVDIDLDTYNITAAAIESWLDDNTQDAARVKAIIPVHLYGQVTDMDAIVALAKARNIAIIEDAAQSIGSGYRTASAAVRAGSLGTMGCFSFFPSKNLGGVGDGGMVVTNDDALATKLQRLRNHGSFPKYYNEMIGGNFRLDAIQAAVLSAKLKHLDSWSKQRQENAAYYDQALEGLAGVVTPKIHQDRAFHIYNQYVLLVENRDALREHLGAAEIGTEIYYPVPFHQQQCFTHLGYEPGAFPNSEKAATCSVAIPIYPELTREMQDYVIKTIKDFYA